ncbi:hypothetical protein B7C51_24770 (plasmid) [Paenibacillus larvae subsp. pulvifaciens]|uniref:SF4 helicase domain-containing protein n=1 Tax=Paenibacillus larvae subsp. pulvifaciens TaxID=1477 RepID=A0A1V0V0K4_9BACL|nr:DnaB-like helicase C-terminal domain-containing protein [Paenibacillus larvae]ARF70690.1 hypothetical protein B7C51_24770 [Paenibacillus larvae subsp. pulvifaciens]
MAVNKKKPDGLEKQRKEVKISEAYLTALFWCFPDNYNMYDKEKINDKTFLNKEWGFFFDLGRYMYEKGITVFDDISVIKHVKELGFEKRFDRYGGFETITEVMDEVENLQDNLEGYYSDVKKYAILQKLYKLFGERVLKETEKYNYRKMTKEQLFIYWSDIVNQIGLDSDSNYDEYYLLENLHQDIKEWDKNPDIGLPYYKSKHMTNITTGIDLGTLTIYGGFGGSGKTSFVFNKFIMSCIENKEKLLVIANEQSVKDFKKLLLVTALGVGTKEILKRQRLNEGNFTSNEEGKLKKAIEWVEEISEGNSKLIAFVFMEDYVMKDVKKIVKRYANRGYRSVLIDTGKPSENVGNKPRWEIITDDFKELYKLARANGNGLNLRMWVNVQLSDMALTRRFLNEHAFGESKKIKNEADVVFMGRSLWDDEYEGGDNEIEAWRWVKSKNGDKGYVKKKFKLKRVEIDDEGNEFINQYYLLFTPKNRRGKDNKNGQEILIFKVNLNNNTWKEVGFCYVQDDRNY